jgi:soluble lytic murein transglycosylase-like protein
VRTLWIVIRILLATLAATAPGPTAPLPHGPAGVSRSLAETSVIVRSEIDAWRVSGGPRPPIDLMLQALYQQRLMRLLSRDPDLAREAIPLLPKKLVPFVRDVVVAHRELVRITPPLRVRSIRVGPAAPAARLLGYYREAEHRFRVPWHVLAAVNFVESAFGKLRSASAAGAQGPMQFMAPTWRAYGLGGNVHDPHDAILGAANYLRASGAPHNLRRALHAYNPSASYVDAVLRYAREIRADVHVFYTLYSWQVFVRTRSGELRLTGPGRR